jgi:hypothetical protein
VPARLIHVPCCGLLLFDILAAYPATAVVKLIVIGMLVIGMLMEGLLIRRHVIDRRREVID